MVYLVEELVNKQVLYRICNVGSGGILNKGSSFRFQGLGVEWKELLSNLHRKVLLHCYEENVRSFTGGFT